MMRLTRYSSCAITVSLCTVSLWGQGSTAQAVRVQRTYRADAYIGLFGVTILSRTDVGGGFAQLEENIGDMGNLHLVFVSGSDPERAHNLNRMGYIEERISNSRSHQRESVYFGFMTANTEENLSDAKKALNKAPTGEVKFVAARGTVNARQSRFIVQNLLLPSTLRWANATQVLPEVEDQLNKPQTEQKPGAGQALDDSMQVDTFLHSVLTAIQSPQSVHDGYCMHNGKLFRLHTVKKKDEKMSLKLYNARLVSSPENAVQMNATIHNVRTGEDTQFRLWFDRASPNPLPVRFEFQPKSYLRLAFEAQPGITARQELAGVLR